MFYGGFSAYKRFVEYEVCYLRIWSLLKCLGYIRVLRSKVESYVYFCMFMFCFSGYKRFVENYFALLVCQGHCRFVGIVSVEKKTFLEWRFGTLSIVIVLPRFHLVTLLELERELHAMYFMWRKSLIFDFPCTSNKHAVYWSVLCIACCLLTVLLCVACCLLISAMWCTDQCCVLRAVFWSVLCVVYWLSAIAYCVSPWCSG